MGKRRQFLSAAAGSALLTLLLFWVFHRPVYLSPEEASPLLRAWLINNFDHADDGPPIDTLKPYVFVIPPQARNSLAFADLELRRPWIKPSDAAHAALARAEITYKGATPAEGKIVLCFLLAQKEDEGWQVRREISESAYLWRLGL